MNPPPSISILIPSYNYARYISKAIESVLAQSHADWELIIIDDASTDDSLEICQRYQTAHPECIRVIASPVNKGLAHSIALGTRESRGTYVAFLEADDAWEKESLSKKLLAIERHDCVLAFTDVRLVGEDSAWKGLLEKDVEAHTRILPSDTPLSLPCSPHQNYIPTFSCVMARRSALIGADFDIPVNAHNLDHWLWAQMSFMGAFAYVSGKLTVRNIHGASYGFRSAPENNLMSALTFSRNKTRYARALARILARQAKDTAPVNPDKVTVIRCRPKGIIARCAHIAEAHRTSESAFWRLIVLAKDLCWMLYARRPLLSITGHDTLDRHA